MSEENPISDQPQSSIDAHEVLTKFEADTKAYLADRTDNRPTNAADPESVHAAAHAWDRETNDAMVKRIHQRLDLVRNYHRARETEAKK